MSCTLVNDGANVTNVAFPQRTKPKYTLRKRDLSINVAIRRRYRRGQRIGGYCTDWTPPASTGADL